MKNIIYFLLFLGYVCYSCTYHPISKQEELLVCADSLIQKSYYDSALQTLNSIPLESLYTSSLQAQYALLLTQAHDKNYIRHTNDSLIRIAVQYYDNTGNISMRAKAHYYWGRIYQDNQDAVGTVREFMQALPLAEEKQDHDLICLLQSNLGHLFYTHGLLEEADSLYSKVERLASEHQDSLRWAVSLIKSADICMEKGEKSYPKAEEKLLKAWSIIHLSDNVPIKKKTLYSLASLYQYMGRTKEARETAQLFLDLEPNATKQYAAFLIIGSSFYKEGQYDSATCYLNKALKSESYYTKYGAYMRLSDIAREQGRYSDALQYEDAYITYKDSAAKKEYPVKVITTLKDMFHHQAIHQYESFLSRSQSYILLIFTILLIVVAGVIWRHFAEKKKLGILLKKQQDIQAKTECFELLLSEKRNEIESLKQHNIECEGDRVRQSQINNCLNGLLEEEKRMVTDLQKVLSEKDEEIKQLKGIKFKRLIVDTPIYQHLLHIKEENARNSATPMGLEDRDWNELISEINSTSFSFTTRLKGQYDYLSENDIRFCCLVKLGFKFSEIALILGCSVDAIYKREKSTLRRMEINQAIKLKEVLGNI